MRTWPNRQGHRIVDAADAGSSPVVRAGLAAWLGPPVLDRSSSVAKPVASRMRGARRPHLIWDQDPQCSTHWHPTGPRGWLLGVEGRAVSSPALSARMALWLDWQRTGVKT